MTNAAEREHIGVFSCGRRTGDDHLHQADHATRLLEALVLLELADIGRAEIARYRV